MEDCVFCKIIKGEIPSYKVYENAEFLAFLDIKPLNKGHVLVIPKKHFRWVQDVEPFGKYWEVTKKITKAITEAFGSDHANYVTLGNAVAHAHIHIVPRYSDDGMGELPDWTRDLKFSDSEMKDISGKIVKAI
jgi:histidine triad (HIT) family protein